MRRELGIEISWHFFSLEEVNRVEGKKHPWQRDWAYGWSQMRLGALLRRDGQDAVDRWYAAAGESGFDRGEPYFTAEGQRTVLDRLGMSPDLLDRALEDPTTSEEVHADHAHLVETFGGHGVPTLVLTGPDGRDQAFFGPVVLTPPEGQAAVRLWHLVTGWTEFGDLYEIRRPKTERDVETINADFADYYRARPWHTVQNPAP